MPKHLISALLALLLAPVVIGASRAEKPDPVVFAGAVRYFDFDAGRAAWIDSSWALWTRAPGKGVDTKTLYTNPYQEVADFESVSRGRRATRRRLVIQKDRLMFLSRRGNDYRAQRVLTAAVLPSGELSRPRQVGFARSAGQDSAGGFITGLAGDESGFSYAKASMRDLEPGCFCRFKLGGGGVWSIVGDTARQLPDVPPAYLLARGAGKIAVLPVEAAVSDQGVPVATASLQVRDAATGGLMTELSLEDDATAAALADAVVAVLVGGNPTDRLIAGSIMTTLRGARIDLYDLATGQRRSSIPAPRDTIPDLQISSDRLLFRTPNSVMMLDLMSERLFQIAETTPWEPAGVAIEGRKVTWVESKRLAPGPPSRKTFQSRLRTVGV